MDTRYISIMDTCMDVDVDVDMDMDVVQLWT